MRELGSGHVRLGAASINLVPSANATRDRIEKNKGYITVIGKLQSCMYSYLLMGVRSPWIRLIIIITIIVYNKTRIEAIDAVDHEC